MKSAFHSAATGRIALLALVAVLAQPFANAPETGQRTLLRARGEIVTFVQTRRKLHPLTQPIQHLQPPLHHARHNHVKTVGAEIDGGHHVGPFI